MVRPLIEPTRQEERPEVIHFPSTLPPIEKQFDPISPSELGGAKILPGDTHDEESDAALAWGRVIHMLLELLPGLSSERRSDSGSSLIAAHPDAALISDPTELLNEALNLIEAEHSRWIFSDGLAEVPITACLPTLEGQRIYGIIDRLVDRDDAVWILDYKSNRIVPNTPEETPEGLIRQMAAYRDAVRLLFPEKPIRAALLWTRTGEMTLLPDALMDAALARVSIP
ncbi:MAG: PD-(D/E)XK nuclease family protein [Pseudomonadota bacterium]